MGKLVHNQSINQQINEAWNVFQYTPGVGVPMKRRQCILIVW